MVDLLPQYSVPTQLVQQKSGPSVLVLCVHEATEHQKQQMSWTWINQAQDSKAIII